MITLRRRLTAVAAALLATVTGAAPGGAPAGAASSADRCYTAALHQVFLGRPASTYDLEAWIDRYEPAPARPALPRALARSDEWLEAVVVGVYDDALDRGPVEADLAYWVGRLRDGARVATLTALVYGSDEVWDRAGATADGFVADVFPRIMGRSPSGGDVAYWAGEVPVRGRGGVARALVLSIENRRARVTGLYQAILGRAPDTGGLDYWAGRVATIDDVELAVHLASSPEAHARAQVGCEVPPPATSATLTDGDRSSLTPQISADGRWIAFLSRARDLVPGDVQDDVTDLFLRDRTTGTTTKVTGTDLSVGRISMSADGRHIVFATAATDLLPIEDGDSGNKIFSWDRETGTFTRVTTRGDATNPRISADGRYVTFQGFDAGPDDAPDIGDGHDVYVWDRTTGAIEILTRGMRPAYTPVVSADGSTVAFTTDAPPTGEGPSGQSRVHLWHRADGSFDEIAPGSEAHGITDDGDVLFTAGDSLRLWDAQEDAVTTIVRRRTPAAGFGARITPDGATVAFDSGAALVPGDTEDRPDVYVWERATGTILRLSDGDAVSARPTTSADGRYVVYHSSPPTGPDAWADIVLWDRGS